ncbi:unnamed protein product [Euphydryas editha]|uniref:FLYWCH-type domain-containing protein n=1 Tax=Euphydryas editha TaxID=104508 RepID=A0AAU9TJM1_EUPED|nr:unnamed protein product [Euphydryas editha]
MKPEFIKSKKGNQLIFMAGYKYYTKKIRKTGDAVRKRWQCSTNSARGCKASITTIDDVIVSLNICHNHEPIPKKTGIKIKKKYL